MDTGEHADANVEDILDSVMSPDIDLYERLGVGKKASRIEIKKAFAKLVKETHPDRNTDDSANEKTHQVVEAYKVLMDPEKKKVYDRTGEIKDEYSDAVDAAPFSAKVSKNDIETFAKEYKFSEEERKDVLEVYEQFKGDMNELMDNVILAELEDEDRFCAIITEGIAKKEVKPYKLYTEETQESKEKRRKKFESEAKEANDLAQEFGLDGSMESLKQQIIARNDTRDAQFLEELEKKYARPTKRKKKGKSNRT